MRISIGCLAAVLVFGTSASLRADSIDDAQAKQRGVSVEQVQLERAQARIQILEKKIKELEATIKEAESRIQTADAATKDAQLKASKSAAELKGLQGKLAALTPGNKVADAKGIVDISTSQLETVGEKYVNKPARMLGTTFIQSTNVWVPELPNVTLESNGIVATINMREHDKWVGFFIKDARDELFQNCFASKEVYGEFLAATTKGTKLNLVGYVVPLNHAGWHGFVCVQIETVKQ